MAIGNYTPPSDEYSRPAGQYLLEVSSSSKYDRHYVRGAIYHQEALLDYQDGDEVLLELVPEPGNPHDPWAVAFHLAGRRIGYIASEFADEMHEYIDGHNRRGRAVLARGHMRILENKTLAATALLPWWRDQKNFRDDSGVPAECRALITALPDEVRNRCIQTARDLAPSDAKKIRALRRMVPNLVWTTKNTTQAPLALRSELLDLFKAQREITREARALEKENARQAKNQGQRAKAQAKIALEEGIRDLARQSMPKTSIALQLGCSEAKVRSTLAASGMKAANANSTSQDARLARARLALELQRNGLTRLEIAAQIECTLDTVKELLKDAKFYEDPTSDLPRLDRMLAVDAVTKTASREETAKILGWTLHEVKASRKDVSTIKRQARDQQQQGSIPTPRSK